MPIADAGGEVGKIYYGNEPIHSVWDSGGLIWQDSRQVRYQFSNYRAYYVDGDQTVASLNGPRIRVNTACVCDHPLMGSSSSYGGYPGGYNGGYPTRPGYGGYPGSPGGFGEIPAGTVLQPGQDYMLSREYLRETVTLTFTTVD